jgi:type VI secretion system protein ImpL
MKTILVIVLKVFLWLLLAAAIAAGAWWLADWRGWPWWAAVAIGAGALGLIVGGIFLNRWYFRRKERQFVKKVVEQDVAAVSATQGERTRLLKDVENRFAKAVDILSASELRKQGDPIYVKPWFLVMGETGSGKSLALRRAKLSSILTDVSQERNIAPTRNVDFWFADEAVILDTAGRYAIPQDELRDREEWERFLALLVKHRHKEPLNGLVLCVAADKLADAGPEVMEEYARGLRRRVNELMRVVGAKFPVYILVTKLDQILGARGLIDLLDDDALAQAMGAIVDNTQKPALTSLDEAMARLVERFKDLRLIVPCQTEKLDPAYLMLPGELERLGQRLKAFIGALFADNPYLETPRFRGVFFASARQSGPAHVLSEDIKDAAAQFSDRAATERGAFLHDLFSVFLPGDRNVFTPMLEFLRWRSKTRLAGVMAWLFVTFCLAGLATLSYTLNERALRVITSEFPKLPELTGGMDAKILTLDQLRRQIINMEKVNENWFLPRMGFDQSLEGERQVKLGFCRLFQEQVMNPLDASMRASLDRLDNRASESAVGLYMGHLMWRIELLKEKERGASLKHLREIPSYPDAVLTQIDPKLLPELAPFYNDLYLYYLVWKPWDQTMAQQLADFKNRLTRLASLKDGRMQWLVDWANTRPYLHPVTLNGFWGGAGQLTGKDISVPAAFTVEGKKAIEAFAKEFDQAVDNSKAFHGRMEAFWTWYAQQYYAAWQSFAEGFHSGVDFLVDDSDKRRMAARMPTFASPYFAMLSRMSKELVAVKGLGPIPNWAQEAERFGLVIAQAQAQAKAEPLLAQEKQKAETAVRKVMGDVDPKQAVQFENLLQATAQFQLYQKALEEMVPAVATQQQAFQFLSQAIVQTGDASGQQQAPAKSPATAADAAVVSASAYLGSSLGAHDVFTQLLRGPLAYFVLFLTDQASCELQSLWESRVLAEMHGLPQSKYRQALFDKKDGLVWKFVTGPARPFLNREVKGFASRSWMGYPFPFQRSFLSFLDEGGVEVQEALPEYDVTMKTVPTTVNPEARQKPYLTTLTLACGGQQQTFNNYNFLDSIQFKWKTDGCGDTTLTISFTDVTVSKVYPGPNGFALFLRDFRSGGSKTYTPEDFPGQKDMLAALGVKRIQVAYVFEGNQPVIRLLSTTPQQIPQSICECAR